MKSIQVTREEMKARFVRFKTLTPRSKAFASSTGIPAEVNEWFAADQNYTLMAPEMPDNSPITKLAAIRGGDWGDAISVSIAVCKPGSGPQLHLHANTVECFFCLKGRFELKWGDGGEHSLLMEPWDFLPVPPRTMRTFINVGDEEGALLVVIQGKKGEFRDTQHSPEAAKYVAKHWGPEMVTRLEAIGRRFTATVDD